MEPGSLGTNQDAANASRSNSNGQARPRPNGQSPQILLDLVDRNDPSRNGRNGGDSPDSGSLYSDEIPSGYNSGEQYDTLSTGYMSGEAYELPETRMDLHEPALDIIEECLQPLDDAHNDSDANIFVLPGQHALDKSIKAVDKDKISVSSSSSDTTGANNAEDNIGRSPNYAGSVKGKFRKKVTTFAIPIENTPLSANDSFNNFDPESSDPGTGAATGGYRAVPSDTDTSAFDSDAYAIGRAGNPPDSGSELLQHASLRSKTKAERIAARKAKRMRRHDEEWFNANDSKWWIVARQVCFWLSIASMIGSSVVAAVMIYLMPRQCDPPHGWYQGKVIIDLTPQADAATNRMYFNLQEASARIPALHALGVQTLHMKELTRIEGSNSANWSYYPTNNSMERYREVFRATGAQLETQLSTLAKSLHDRNMTLMVQVPLVGQNNESSHGSLSLDLEYEANKLIQFWAKIGADGIFVDGLEHFGADDWVSNSVSKWANIFTRDGVSKNKKILMASYKFAHNLQEASNAAGDKAMEHLGLLDATIDLENANMTQLSSKIADIAAWDATESRPWINWNLEGTGVASTLTKAQLAFQMLLPGTITVRDLNTTAAAEASVGGNRTLADNATLRNLTSVRTLAVPIFMNGNYRRCECERGFEKETNYAVKETGSDLVQLERFYSRRNRYILVANFGEGEASLETVGNMYSGGEMLVDTSRTMEVNREVKIKELRLQSGHAFVIKLPK